MGDQVPRLVHTQTLGQHERRKGGEQHVQPSNCSSTRGGCAQSFISCSEREWRTEQEETWPEPSVHCVIAF